MTLAVATGVSAAILPRAIDSLHADNSGYNYTGNQITITMGDNYFSPAAVTVTPGTVVVWVNRGSMAHTVTSDNGLFDSGSINPGQSFSYIFSGIGTFGYHCRFHGGAGGAGMAGSVQVSGQNNNYYNNPYSYQTPPQNCPVYQTPYYNQPSNSNNSNPGISGLSGQNNLNYVPGVTNDTGKTVGSGSGCIVTSTHECLY